MVTTSLQGRGAAGTESLRRYRSMFGILGDVKAFKASYILSYNVVQDHEGYPSRGIAVSGRRRTSFTQQVPHVTGQFFRTEPNLSHLFVFSAAQVQSLFAFFLNLKSGSSTQELSQLSQATGQLSRAVPLSQRLSGFLATQSQSFFLLLLYLKSASSSQGA